MEYYEQRIEELNVKYTAAMEVGEVSVASECLDSIGHYQELQKQVK